ncbi:hypothetical protein pEaSNUABM30_00049 [Erwinia phage pEa_SNUABM_30]|uniref:Uncharacterized protein n=1 Tax=Erwinia phage pEa_SNUABM_30 TaxID=2869553 RepID=A0AAE8XKP6_9CAUD|nr:hypothetical protein MPK69_gp049 [Erwinia phage pEa_SNUABM_30]UAW53167.1 hypothetical protein pEaSNUABM30_00049 [Erwinia phage pEa_SNUABM_30]
MFYVGLGLGIVIGIILTLFCLWFFFLKGFAVFKP